MRASVRGLAPSRGAIGIGLTIDAVAQGDWTVLVVEGELDLFTCPALRDRVGAAVAARAVAIDLSGVSFVDSSGLGAVIGARRAVERAGGRFATIAPPGSALARLLSLAGIDQLLPVVPSRAELEALA